MKLSELKNKLSEVKSVNFSLPDGKLVPAHFHVTEVGLITKHFIDCGGTERTEKVINFQLWEASDFDHRISPEKLLHIIDLSDKILQKQDLEIEVEYQSQTVGKYNLGFDGTNFNLLAKRTDCLASDHCGIPASKQKVKLEDLSVAPAACCAPGGGCC